MINKHMVRILLAEDNDGDVFLVRRALEKKGLIHELTVMHNGEEALRWLDSDGQKADRTPDLILLDLNLPRIDGGQLLSHIRKTDIFSCTPVIVPDFLRIRQKIGIWPWRSGRISIFGSRRT